VTKVSVYQHPTRLPVITYAATGEAPVAGSDPPHGNEPGATGGD
jgi:hypothetical protein